MKYNLLGNTGVLVSELCFGTMTFGGQGYWEAIGKQTQDEATNLLKSVVDAGINFIDTANVYSFGQSEQLLGEGIKQAGLARNELFIATKVRGRMAPGVNQIGLSRYHIMQSVEESLQRLQLDHIDLLYVHGVDAVTSVEQIVHSLHDVVTSGKVRYVGVCNWPAWMVMKALGIAKQRGWHEFVAMQYFYAAANRDVEQELIPLALEEQVGFMPWSPLAGGFLSGKFTRNQTNTGGQSRRDSFDFPVIDKEKAYDVIDVLIRLGESYNVSAAEIALAWVRQQKGVTSTIIGAKTPEQLASNIHSTTFELSATDLDELNAVSLPEKRYPGWMVERQMGDRLPAADKK
ncbi:aldo/keto reductase [Adhaeribacter pallidiroseus]|uniref:Putative aryl-alcohol dehydrogenase n=1 Tax=Adhaeribacter pallidiroseus TaxID=2072847 RepID=A0A369QU89_9BACT|nr:aldo/keto reductase [Adhaeribacter pallidiroseus]RDC66369.1 putative aryl-alcohol dehydrogenase [Adhaeribacter pallidiroseus]